MIETSRRDHFLLSGDDRAPLIFIVGAKHLHYELIAFYLAHELNAKCTFHAELASVDFSGAKTDRPEVLLLDCLNLEIADLQKSFSRYASLLPDQIHIALFNVAPKVKLVHFVKQHKIRGIFYKDDSQLTFKNGIRTILEGGLWLSRKMLSDCIRMSLQDHKPLALCMKKLSNREWAILKSVALGDTNKEIARQLCISVHTVKTHLYKIYRKIEVPNRTHAALWFNSYFVEILSRH
jgi:DNA-binding NarL/FixJ family response regulator